MLEPATAQMVCSLSERPAEIISVAQGTERALRVTGLNGCFRAERSLPVALENAIAGDEPKAQQHAGRSSDKGG